MNIILQRDISMQLKERNPKANNWLKIIRVIYLISTPSLWKKNMFWDSSIKSWNAGMKVFNSNEGCN